MPYLTRDEMIQAFLDLETAYPSIVSHQEYTNATTENRSLYVFRFGDNTKGKVMFDGACHGDEPISSEVLLKYAQWLCAQTDPAAKRIIKENYTLIIPIVNMDKYDVQRKNARVSPGPVDLNRNFDYDWGLRGASTDPASPYYQGPSAESEPECQTMRTIWNDYQPFHYLNCHAGDTQQFWYARGGMAAYAHSVHEKYKVEADQRGESKITGLTLCPGSGCFDCTPYNKNGIFGWSAELNSSKKPDYSQVEPTFDKFLPFFITISRESENPETDVNIELVFGDVKPPPCDIINAQVHLGCTKEVSSFNVLLQNWDKKYSASGTVPIVEGDDVTVKLGRNGNLPLLLTGTVEKPIAISGPVSHYMRVRGRCIGERLFRRHVTKTYEAMKAESIVADIIENYTTLEYITGVFGDYSVNYTMVDPNSKLATEKTRARFTDMIRNESCYVYIDEGAGFFTDFEHGITARITAGDQYGYAFLNVFSNELGGFGDFTQPAIGIQAYISNAAKTKVRFLIRENYNSTWYGTSEYEGDVGKVYFFQVKKDGIYYQVKVYSDREHTDLLATLNLTLQADHSFRYHMPIASSATSGSEKITGVSINDNWIDETDTTYTLLEYDDKPVFDILQYIAATADFLGTIGFDFRINPDGKFAFLRKNAYTSAVSLTETLEHAEYARDISRVRNKIIQKGAKEATLPRSQDRWTEPPSDPPPKWVAVSSNTTIARVSSSPTPQVGSWCVKVSRPAGNPQKVEVYMIITDEDGNDAIIAIDSEMKLLLKYWSAWAQSLYVKIYAPDDSNYFETKSSWYNSAAGWEDKEIPLGKDNQDQYWNKIGKADWRQCARIGFWTMEPPANPLDVAFDGIYISKQRWMAVEDNSPTEAELRELTDIDEELHSDEECALRAKALLDFLADAAETILAWGTKIDYGTTPILAGQKNTFVLPNENVNSAFREDSIDYFYNGIEETLTVTLNAGKLALQLADYLYVLRSRTSKLAVTKKGKSP